MGEVYQLVAMENGMVEPFTFYKQIVDNIK